MSAETPRIDALIEAAARDAEIARLRAALQKIVDRDVEIGGSHQYAGIARSALAGGGK
jgi:hypothetical protein